MARVAIEDPLKVFRFRVTINGFSRTGFSEVTGLDRTTDVANYREGGMNDTVQKSAGLTKFGDITLKRGLVIGGPQDPAAADFLSWASQVADSAVKGNAPLYRRDISIYQYHVDDSTVACCWLVTNCWPIKYVPTAGLKGDSNDNSIEELVLANEGWYRTI